MKLFGNKRNAARSGGRGAAHSGARQTQKKHRLSGVQRGCLLILAAVAVLCLSVFAIYKDFVKPVELKKPEQPKVEIDIPEEEKFTPPTRVEVEIQVDQDTGEEIAVEVEVPVSQKEGFYNILIVGTDDDGVRTDTIMIGRLNTKDHTVALLSIPRDTLIDADYKVPKINAVYGKAGGGEKGMESLKNRLASLLGFEVNGYVLVDLEAFVKLVDLVGGVEFDVPQRMYYNDPAQDLYIDLEKGWQTLNGEEAMGLVRFRKGYASQDIMRTQVQQDFLQALAKKCLSVVNLTKVGEMADLFAEYVLTDLSVGNLAYFGQELLKCDFENMYSYTLEGEGVYLDGISYWAIYLNKNLQVINDYFNPYDTDLTADHVRILTPEYIRAVYPQEPEEDPAPEEQPPAEEDNPEEVLPPDWNPDKLPEGLQPPGSGETPENNAPDDGQENPEPGYDDPFGTEEPGTGEEGGDLWVENPFQPEETPQPPAEENGSAGETVE